jgi:hypothetical protein
MGSELWAIVSFSPYPCFVSLALAGFWQLSFPSAGCDFFGECNAQIPHRIFDGHGDHLEPVREVLMAFHDNFPDRLLIGTKREVSMWFNIAMSNHGPIEAYELLSPLIDHMKGTLSKCGHDITVSHDQLFPDAINLYYEMFRGTEAAAKLLSFKAKNTLKVGVIATELMIGGTIPYATHGINLPRGADKERHLRDRLDGFSTVAAGVDFLWCLLERTANEYRHLNPQCRFFPVGHVHQSPPDLRQAPKDIDIVFFGSKTPHRVAVLSCLVNAGLRVMPVGRGFRTDWLPQSLLLALLDRAKIGLNLTLHTEAEGPAGVDPRFASCMRLVEMFDRDLCVVSEEIPFDNPYQPYMISATVAELPTICRDLLIKDQWRLLGQRLTAEFRRDMDVTLLCKPIIDQTIAALLERK